MCRPGPPAFHPGATAQRPGAPESHPGVPYLPTGSTEVPVGSPFRPSPSCQERKRSYSHPTLINEQPLQNDYSLNGSAWRAKLALVIFDTCFVIQVGGRASRCRRAPHETGAFARAARCRRQRVRRTRRGWGRQPRSDGGGLPPAGRPAARPALVRGAVYHVGYWSHYDNRVRRSAWFLPKTASCAALGEFASKRDLLRDTPQVGDVFLMYSAKVERFAHTGIVVGVDETVISDDIRVCTTIEGNTNDDGSSNGHTTLRKTRAFSNRRGDRFLRWVDMEL